MKHSRIINGERHIWQTENLWRHAQPLKPFTKTIDDIPEVELNCWFNKGAEPTIRNVSSHAKRVIDADLSLPVILNDKGELMDGGHRIAKALLEGNKTILAVQFDPTPPADQVVSVPLPER